MQSYQGEFILERELDKKSLLKAMVDILWENEHLDNGEAGFDTIEIMRGEAAEDETPSYQWLSAGEGEYAAIMAEAKALLDGRMRAEAEALQAEAQKKRVAEEAVQQERDRQQYERLKAKFDATV
jgi:hypothetical protein